MAAIDQAPPELPALRFARAALWLGARVISVVLLVAAWELVARSGAVTQVQLPALS
jgi:ABC-type nitrate/sulfonate/bicarbonate transport system permease component